MLAIETFHAEGAKQSRKAHKDVQYVSFTFLAIETVHAEGAKQFRKARKGLANVASPLRYQGIACPAADASIKNLSAISRGSMLG